MSSSCCNRALLAALWLAAVPYPASAQRGHELGIQAAGTFADFDFGGGGLWAALRPGGSTRIGLSLMPGAVEGELGGRAEVVGHFLVSPNSQGRTLYAGGGASALVGVHDQVYLLLVVGLESRPGGGSGWVIETGLGGGVRVLLGYRWRRLRR
jgi:hypothetical protein